MRIALLLAAGAGAVLAMPSPALAGADRMQLACEGLDLVVERSNGSSWWGNDGVTYTTRYLRVADSRGVYEKHFGHAASEHLVCTADHDSGDYRSRWTVHLVAAQ